MPLNDDPNARVREENYHINVRLSSTAEVERLTREVVWARGEIARLLRTVDQLASATRHLLHDHGCDAHGYESVMEALRCADSWLVDARGRTKESR